MVRIAHCHCANTGSIPVGPATFWYRSPLVKTLACHARSRRVRFPSVSQMVYSGSVLPRIRGDCLAGGFNEARPCLVTQCRHHLSGIDHSCALDVADEGEHTLEEVAEIMNLSRERIRQLEWRALRKLRYLRVLQD